MPQRQHTILEELDSMLMHRDKENIVESRASNVIAGAVQLINYIRENFDSTTADDLEKRLINSIRSQDPEKFSRGIQRAKNK